MADAEAIHPDFADLWPTSRGRIDAAVADVERGVSGLDAGRLTDGDREVARTAAHKLVGTLGTYGLTETAATVREIELAFADDGAAGDPSQLRDRLDAVIR